MKKFYIFAVASLATQLTFSQDSNDTVTFESFNLGANSYYDGADEAGQILIGEAKFSNNFDTQYQSWDGFAVSKVQNVTTAGYTNQFASFANGGANGSQQYGVFFQGYGVEHTIEFNVPRLVKSLQVTNTTYAGLSMENGDSYAKKFGSLNGADGNPDGTNGEDFFLLKIIPLDGNDLLVGDTIEFYLADYRFSDDNDDYIINTWETITFDDLVAKKIKFNLSSSDNGNFGMNTPAYFALDNLVFSPTVGLKSNNQLSASIFPNPTQGELNIIIENNAELQLFNTVGQLVKSESVNGQTKVDVNNLPAGIYQLSLTSETGSHTQKVVIK